MAVLNGLVICTAITFYGVGSKPNMSSLVCTLDTSLAAIRPPVHPVVLRHTAVWRTIDALQHTAVWYFVQRWKDVDDSASSHAYRCVPHRRTGC